MNLKIIFFYLYILHYLKFLRKFPFFETKKGLYLDEHLVTELTPDTDFKVGRDRLFIGFELLGVTNPTMVIIIQKLWATKTPGKVLNFLNNIFKKWSKTDIPLESISFQSPDKDRVLVF